MLEHKRGPIWLRRQAMSARDVILREFESKHIRAFMGWMSAPRLQVPMSQAGTGFLPCRNNCSTAGEELGIPKGGSGKLTDALVAT